MLSKTSVIIRLIIPCETFSTKLPLSRGYWSELPLPSHISVYNYVIVYIYIHIYNLILYGFEGMLGVSFFFEILIKYFYIFLLILLFLISQSKYYGLLSPVIGHRLLFYFSFYQFLPFTPVTSTNIDISESKHFFSGLFIMSKVSLYPLC